MMKYNIIKLACAILCLFFIGCSVSRTRSLQIREGLDQIPFNCIDSGKDNTCKQLKKENKACRKLITQEMARSGKTGDTIVVIEQIYGNYIGYQTCYVYDTNTDSIGCYTFGWKKKKPFLKSEVYKYEQPQNKDSYELRIINSFFDHTFESCLGELAAFNHFSPCLIFRIVICIRINDEYKFKYYSTSEYDQIQE